MPREIINSENDDRKVEVTWSKDKYVQLVTALLVNDYSTLEVDVMVGITKPVPKKLEGQYITLDRAGCNKLIYILRKARDQAFGKDQ